MVESDRNKTIEMPEPMDNKPDMTTPPCDTEAEHATDMNFFEIPDVQIMGLKLFTTNAEVAESIARLIDIAQVELTDLYSNDEGLTKTVVCPLNKIR